MFVINKIKKKLCIDFYSILRESYKDKTNIKLPKNPAHPHETKRTAPIKRDSIIYGTKSPSAGLHVLIAKMIA